MAREDEALLRELHAGLAVLKSQQSEINRRLGLIETALDEADQEEDEKRDGWWTWFMQTVGQVLLVSLLVALGKVFGLEVSW
jgi:uncharacterized protein with gpF-like domain